MSIRFKDLKIGQHFTFTPGKWGSYHHAVNKKVSAKCYVWSGRKFVKGKYRNHVTKEVEDSWISRTGLMKGCVGALNVAVDPGKIRKAKLPRGRGRGGGKL